MTLIIPVGIPGCGKSTFFHRFFCATPVISSDQIRLDLMGDTYDHSKNGEVFERFHWQINWELKHGSTVVADATNLERRARETLYEIAQRQKAFVNVILFTNVEQAVKRNAARPIDAPSGWSYVPEGIMQDKMIPRFEQTLREIDTEPWDTLTRIESMEAQRVTRSKAAE